MADPPKNTKGKKETKKEKQEDQLKTAGTTSYFYFLIVTTLFTLVKYNIGEGQHAMATMCYVFSVIVGEYILNLNTTKTLCGSQNWKMAFMTTIIPWVLMFGIIMIVLNIYPGWISPFSNTIGYGFARLAGSKKLLNAIFPPEPTSDETKSMTTNQVEEVKQSLAYIYSDQSILMNEVTLQNFGEFWNKTRPLRSEESETNPSYKEKFRKIIQLKTLVGEYIWYLLTGSLVISVGYNYSVSPGCPQTLKSIKEQHDEIEKKLERRAKKTENQP